MTTVDWIALAVVALAALSGLRRGLVAGAFGLGGLVLGAYLGSKVAPDLVGDAESRYTPLIALAGAVTGAVLLQAVAATAGGVLRTSLLAVPPLRLLDALGGAVLGAATGLALVWVAGAVALHVPGQTELRREVQRSELLRRLNREFPPQRLLDAIERVDPFAAIRGPEALVPAPDPQLLRQPAVRLARASVVRVVGNACGLGVSGSGWIAARGLVVTNAHVVAGVRTPQVDRRDGNFRDAVVVAFDPRNDVAVLRVAGLGGRALSLAAPETGAPVAILGYPQSGPFQATAGRIGQTAEVLADDAYGRGPVRRAVTTLRGRVRHGNSGGPAVDSRGRVQTTVFAARVGSASGYGVPTEVVRAALGDAKRRAVPTGPCVG